MAPQREVVLKFTSRRYKKENVSYEDFHTFAACDFSPKAAQLQARHGFLGVRQVHSPPQIRTLLTEGPFAAMKPPSWIVADHDIEIVFYVRGLEQLGAVMADPEFQELLKLELQFVDQERATISIGWEEVYVENGKVVNVEDGQSLYQPWAESVEKLTGKKPVQ